MQKMPLLVIVAMAAAAPAIAQDNGPKQLTYDEAIAQNAKSWKLVKEGLPLVLPTWALPFYFTMYKNPDGTQQTGKKSHKKK
jgi:hypothetical protein